jgi:hypothetical protein
MNKENVAGRKPVLRAFTVHQVRQLLCIELPKIVQKYQIRSVIVPGLLNAFDDPNMRMKDVKKEISKITQAISELSTKVLVVTSVEQQGGRKSERVLCTCKKRINLVQEEEKHGTLKAEIYNHGNSKVVNLKERELKITPKK